MTDAREERKKSGGLAGEREGLEWVRKERMLALFPIQPMRNQNHGALVLLDSANHAARSKSYVFVASKIRLEKEFDLIASDPLKRL